MISLPDLWILASSRCPGRRTLISHPPKDRESGGPEAASPARAGEGSAAGGGGGRGLLLLIVIFTLARGIVWAILVPYGAVPDEQSHFNYVMHLRNTGRLPVHYYHVGGTRLARQIVHPADDPDPDAEALGPAPTYCSVHPPLYYALCALPLRILGTGPETSALISRGVSIFLSALTIGLIGLLARDLLPREPYLAALIPVAAALLPQYAFLGSAINNENLAHFIAAGMALLWTRSLLHGLTSVRAARLGILCGLWFLTKGSFPIGLVGTACVIALAFRRERPGARVVAWRIAAVVAPAALLALPLIIRNLAIYGGPTGMSDNFSYWQSGANQWDTFGGMILGGNDDDFIFLRTLFRSFWAYFDWMTLAIPHQVLYTACGLLSLLGAAGLGVRLLRHRQEREALPLLLLTAAGLVNLGLVAAFCYWLSYQPQGRHLFSSLGVAAFALTAGPASIFGGGRRGIAAAAGVVVAMGWFHVYCLAHVIAPAYGGSRDFSEGPPPLEDVARVGNDRTAGQTFVARADRLTAVGLHLEVVGGPGRSSWEIEVEREDGSVIGSTTFSPSRRQGVGIHWFELPEEESSAGRGYTVRLRKIPGSGGRDLLLRGSREDVYPDGNLLLGGEARRGDLSFALRYAPGSRGSIVPEDVPDPDANPASSWRSAVLGGAAAVSGVALLAILAAVVGGGRLSRRVVAVLIAASILAGVSTHWVFPAARTHSIRSDEVGPLISERPPAYRQAIPLLVEVFSEGSLLRPGDGKIAAHLDGAEGQPGEVLFMQPALPHQIAPVAIIPVRLQGGGRFRFTPWMDPEAMGAGSDGASFSVSFARLGETPRILWERDLSVDDLARRKLVEVALPAGSPSQAFIHLSTGPGPAGNPGFDVVGWAEPMVFPLPASRR
ncbi:MAG: hypothetical protein O7H41_19600 [Planctomycetota bacterium]|nr:hypothetical protein [Planctomycetota bacterium]